MKQIFALFVVILLILPVALAQDTETPDEEAINPSTGEEIDDEETKNEIALMDTPKGAKVRFLQLEKRIIRNIDRAQGVVEYIKENYEEPDTDKLYELETYIEEMEMLLEDVQAVTVENPDQGTVKQFVDLKHDAIELTKAFKEKAKEILIEDDVEELQETLQEREGNQERSLEKQQEVAQAIREHNAHRIQVMLEAMGSENTELAEKVRSGELNFGRANSELLRQYATLNTEEKAAVRTKLKEEVQARNKFRDEAMEIAKNQYFERRDIRLRNRIDQLHEFEEPAVANSLIAARMNKVEIVKEDGKSIRRLAVAQKRDSEVISSE